MEGRLNRFLRGDDGTVVSVKVEMITHDIDKVIAHNLRNTSDFDTIDFFIPLALMIMIFILNYAAKMLPLLGLISMGIQIFLVWDLHKRVRRRANGRTMVGLVRPYESSAWGWSFLVYFLVLPVDLFLEWLNRYLYHILFPPQLPDFDRVFSDTASITSGSIVLLAIGIFFFLLQLFSIAIFAPWYEELWFRGVGLAGFMKQNNSPIRCVLWTSTIFGILHGSTRVLGTSFLGMVMGFLRFRTGSLYCCMAIHAFHNFLAFLVFPYVL